MKEPMAQLLAVQQLDRKLMRFRREVRDIPARKKALDQEKASAEGRLNDIEQRQRQNAAEQGNLESEIESLREQIKRYKRQQLDVKTNDEYRALTHEISAVEQKISQLEDREIELMETAERLNAEHREARERLDDEEDRIGAEKEALDRRLEEVQRDLDEVSARREEKAAKVDKRTLAHYKRIFDNRGDYAVVPIENGVCTGCHMKVTPQTVHDAQAAQKLVACNYCGRLLYVPADHSSS